MMEAITNKAKRRTGRGVTIRNISVLLLLVSFVVAGVGFGRKIFWPEREEPRAKDSSMQPASCRFVLAPPMSVDTAIDQQIQQQQTVIMKGGSSEATAFERLGWLFVKKARLSFDAGFYKLAEQCAACLEARGASGPDTLLLRAHVLQSLHHFSAAEAVARELIKLRERPFDYGVLGDILIDQGKLHEGAAAYQKMVDLRPDLQSYARAAHVRWLTGDLDGAIELMHLATTAGSPNDPEAAAWAFTRLALYQLQRGAAKQAMQSCDAALALQSDYAPAMLARGRILLSLNRTSQAVVELRRAVNLNSLPEYQWALSDALTVTGDRNQAAELESQIVQRSAEDPRTLSLFLATHQIDVERAVQVAQQELTNRGDVFTLDALAWSLAAVGRSREAQQYSNKALSQGTTDPRLYLHAGVIAALNHDNRQAKRWLQKAAATQQMLLPCERVQLDAWRQKLAGEVLCKKRF
jgi:tetratricopeptide (TPR) repeat protein